MYPKFGHFYNALMGSMSKVLVDGLSIVVATHANDTWIKKVVGTRRV